jgi:ketosteroid isomerase-like protein
MAEHENAVLVRRAFDAFVGGDFDGLTDMFAEGAQIHEPGHGAISGDYTGRNQVAEFFTKLLKLTGGTFKAELIDILADDDRAVVIERSTATRKGQTLDTLDVLVCEIGEGRIVSAQVFPADQQAENVFWSNMDWPRATFFGAVPRGT